MLKVGFVVVVERKKGREMATTKAQSRENVMRRKEDAGQSEINMYLTGG
jgi:hypothetical protein